MVCLCVVVWCESVSVWLLPRVRVFGAWGVAGEAARRLLSVRVRARSRVCVSAMLCVCVCARARGAAGR